MGKPAPLYSMRCFILGNGPSLKVTPLERLKGEVTFAVNNIHKIFPYTDWRPTHYVRSEQPVDEIEEATHLEINAILNDGAHGHFPHSWRRWVTHPNVTLYHTCRHFKYDIATHPRKGCAWWHGSMLCDHGSCVTMAIQIANKLGYDEIYLLGCDLGFTDDKSDHFYNERDSAWPAEKRLRNILFAHETAIWESKAKIYNATIGGELETYERVNLDEILCNR